MHTKKRKIVRVEQLHKCAHHLTYIAKYKVRYGTLPYKETNSSLLYET